MTDAAPETAALPWAALAVVLPLAAMLLASVSARLGRTLALPLAGAGLGIAGGAVLHVVQAGPFALAVGGWPAPLGIMLRVDGLAAAFLAVGALVGGAALLAARRSFSDAATRRSAAFWPLAYGLIAALNAAFVSGDLFNLFVALELLTVCAVGLVALEGSAAAVTAALRYLLFALLGSLAYLMGVVLLYLAHGTLDLQLLSLRLAGTNAPPVAGALLTVGLMAKAALFPVHGWLASAHAAAPPAASALLSALVVKAPFLVLLRLWWDVLGPPASPLFAQLMGALGAAAIVMGSLQALRQRRLKLVIAYSTVAQLGYLLLAFPIVLAAGEGAARGAASAAWTGVAFHALAHALAKGAMFLSAGLMAQAVGHDRVAGLAGLGRTLPITAFAFAIAAVSLMGLPPSGGFTGKYLLLVAALGSGQWWWAVVMLAGGLLAAGYLFRPLARLMTDRPVTLRAHVPRRAQAVALVLALASVGLGLLSAEPYALLQVGRPMAGAGVP